MPKHLYITDTDKEKLKKKLDDERKSGQGLTPAMRKLEQEINDAEVIDSTKIPQNVITMRSRAILHLNEEDIEVSLVYPEEEDWSLNKLSVLSPIGTAILGYKEGDVVEWEVPSGITQIQIKQVLYQPEAAGDYHM
jgi:regulator of nucleoside diphosphate kinase